MSLKIISEIIFFFQFYEFLVLNSLICECVHCRYTVLYCKYISQNDSLPTVVFSCFYFHMQFIYLCQDKTKYVDLTI